MARRLALAGAVGAGVAGVMLVAPDFTGGGYATIREALDVQMGATALLGVLALRFVMTWASYASGVPGGIFAPMLALGTLAGLAFGVTASELLPWSVPHHGMFAVAGMAAFFAAVVRAPLTGIILTLEMTGDFGLMLVLVATSMCATFAAEALGGRPIYEQLLERTLAATKQQPAPHPTP